MNTKQLFLAIALSAQLVILTMVAPAQAQTDNGSQIDRERLERLIDQGLPPVIGEDNSQLVERMLAAKMGTPISRALQFDRLIEQTTGKEPTSMSSECRQLRSARATPTASGVCLVELGKENGEAAYRRLEIDPVLARGNLLYISRAELRELQPEDLKLMEAGDAEVYRQAIEFLQRGFGIDLVEIPRAPRGTDSLQVSHLNIGFGHEERFDALPPVTVQKAVHLRRGLAVEGITDPASGHTLTYLPAPGEATIAIDASGMVLAAVSDWQELQVDPRMKADQALSRKQLVAEIAEDLMGGRLVDLERISATLVLDSDWRDNKGYLLPAVEIQIRTVPRDMSQEEQKAMAGKGTAGSVRTYSLVQRRQEELDRR